jgi:hypothetical protein
MNIYKHKGHINNWGQNKIIYQHGADKLLDFSKNIKKYPNDFSLKYYRQNPIEYKLNNEGFRTPDDFNNEDDGNIFLGCSHTFGIGLHLENTWSYKLSQIIGGKFWNLSIPGTGAMTHYRLLKGYYKDLKIKNIFHLAPKEYFRYEFIVNNEPLEFIIGYTNKKTDEILGNLILESLINDDQLDIMYNSHIDAIKWLAHEIGANYYLCDDVRGFYIKDDESLKARDLKHFSVSEHDLIYKNFLKQYDNNLYEKYKNEKSIFFNIEDIMKDKKNNLI